MYSAAGFSYGNDEDEGEGVGDDDKEDEIMDDAEDDMIQAAEDDEDALNAVAEGCGIRNFIAQLQRAVVQEEAEAAKSFKKQCVYPFTPIHGIKFLTGATHFCILKHVEIGASQALFPKCSSL